MRLLLGSGGYSTKQRLHKWTQTFDSFLGPIKNVLFIPYAIADHDVYVSRLTERGFSAGRRLTGIHTLPNAREAVLNAEAIFVGGGNSFRLLNELYRNDLIPLIRDKIKRGTPYIGVSAGTNMACPTMKTTNDMPIVYPPSLDAIGLISFQINPHYFSGPIHIKTENGFIPYGGETRDDRIREFHEMNLSPVVGLGEGSHLWIEDGRITLGGHQPQARLFRRSEPFVEMPSDQDLVRLHLLKI